MNNESLERLLTSRKYREVCPETIRRIWEECQGRYRREKDAQKAVREQLHGITGAFWNEGEYRHALDLLEGGDWEKLLPLHASTRERMPLERMDDTYGRLWKICNEPQSILDLACGLNPVYLAYRHPTTPVDAIDINGQCVRLLQRLPNVRAKLGDLLCENGIPVEHHHIALLFKVLPLLERQKRGSAAAVMACINAQYLVVSFPTRSLSGRNVGMEEHYSRWMQENLPADRRIEDRFSTDNELFYVLKEL